jgi:hypothetical protein
MTEKDIECYTGYNFHNLKKTPTLETDTLMIRVVRNNCSAYL